MPELLLHASPAVWLKTSRSAGWRDSALTSHGVIQADRLGAHLVARSTSIGPVTRIFSSDLQRASSTAQAVLDAQNAAGLLPAPRDGVAVVQVADIRERDYRAAEGTSFRDRSANALLTDAESPVEMRARVDRFVETHLQPALSSPSVPGIAGEHSVVVVAHGTILGVLVRSLMLRFSSGEPCNPQPDAVMMWRNTGYLEALVRHQGTSLQDSAAGNPGPISVTVTAVNCVDHLRGLTKTRGGIGSAKFDGKQRTMDSFFGSMAKPGKQQDDGG